MSYRVPREPSTPRIAIWRKLKGLGVAQIGDGLVGLPNNPRTREHLEWVAASVVEAEGQAIVWLAKTAGRRPGQELAREMSAARDVEYQQLLDELAASVDPDTRNVARWRREWRRIDRRDYFQASLREPARRALDAVAAGLDPVRSNQ